MAEKRTRRRFTARFETEAFGRLLEGGKGPSEVATGLGLSPGQLGGWRDERLSAGSAEALARRRAEVQRLKREDKRLKEGARSSTRPPLFSPGGSRVPVRVRGRRAGE